MVYGGFVLHVKNPGPITSILQWIIIILSGAFFPITSLPKPAEIIGRILPVTYVADLIRHSALNTSTLLPVNVELAISFFSTVASLAVGYLFLRKIEDTAKKSGKLGVY